MADTIEKLRLERAVGGKFMEEIERLRSALVALLVDAYQNGWHARDAEVERLRKLLGDGLTSNIPEWRERVREAIGE